MTTLIHEAGDVAPTATDSRQPSLLDIPPVQSLHKRLNSAQARNRRYRTLLINGTRMIRFFGDKSEVCMLWVNPTLERLYWGIPQQVLLPSKRFNVLNAQDSIPLKSITCLIVDRKKNKSSSNAFRTRFDEAPSVCLSLVLDDDSSIDIEAPTSSLRDRWAEAMGNVAFGAPVDFSLGDEDDDFDSDVDDSMALKQADRDQELVDNVEQAFTTAQPNNEFKTQTPNINSTANYQQFNEPGKATDAYENTYGRKLSQKLQIDIAKHGKKHRRTNSFITKTLMAKDERFCRLAKFVQSVRETFKADRGALYLVDQHRKTANSVVIEGQQGHAVVCNFMEGFVGHTAATGEILIIPDAYADARFDREFDLKTSFKTTSVLVAPVKNCAGEVIGVIELINRQDHPYTRDWFTVEHAAGLLRLVNELAIIISGIRDFEMMITLKRMKSLDWIFNTEEKNEMNNAGVLDTTS